MSDENFSKFLVGVEDVKAHLQGKITLKTTRVSFPEAPSYSSRKIKALRKRLRMSQAVFAEMLNVSLKTVCKWESDDRNPSGASARLLQIIEKEPEVLLGA